MKDVILANFFRGKEAVGGHIHFDEKGLTFKSHRFNIHTGETRIEYANILRVNKRRTLGIVPNGISIIDNTGFEYKFVIYHREEVIAFLNSKIAHGPGSFDVVR